MMQKVVVPQPKNETMVWEEVDKQLQNRYATAAHATTYQRSSAVGYPERMLRQSAHVPEHRGLLARAPFPQ